MCSAPRQLKTQPDPQFCTLIMLSKVVWALHVHTPNACLSMFLIASFISTSLISISQLFIKVKSALHG